MRSQTSLDKAPQSLLDFEKEKRRFLISHGRYRAAQEFLTAFAGLSLSPNGLAVTSSDSLADLDPATHFLRLIPKGPRVRVISQFGQVTVSFPKSGKRMIFDESREPFSALAIFDASEKTFWVTELLSFRSFEYRKIGFRVGRFLARTHFPADLMCSFDGYSLRKLPETPFSVSLLHELAISRLLHCRFAEVTSSETGNTFRVSAPCRILKHKLTLLFRLHNGFLATADGHMLPLRPEWEESADGAKVSVPFQRTKLLRLLLSFLSEQTAEAMEVESESGPSESLLALTKPLLLKKLGRLVVTRQSAAEKVASALEQAEAALNTSSI